ncbi:MAG: hypothetical protein K2M94_05335 [Paramuribaculum sp.]|nr:hypothetical protein [Paramuribaculum sp.]
MVKNTISTSDTSSRLIDRLVVAIGRRLITSTDYQYAAEWIAYRTGQYVSPTTLKRIGGYLDEAVVTRRSTLDLLARALGYKDFGEFCSDTDKSSPDSDPACGNWLDTSELKRGVRIELTWCPDRRCVIEFIGDDRWVVVEAVATRLKSGQCFRCNHFIAGEPLQILLEPSVLTPRQAAYVCGKERGVRFTILNS